MNLNKCNITGIDINLKPIYVFVFLNFRRIRLPVLPRGLQIMADQGFANHTPLLIPLSRQGDPMRGMMKRDFHSCRTTIERVFGLMKSAYSSVGTRRFRSRRFLAPLICNVSAALSNRRKSLFTVLRQQLHL